MMVIEWILKPGYGGEVYMGQGDKDDIVDLGVASHGSEVDLRRASNGGGVDNERVHGEVPCDASVFFP